MENGSRLLEIFKDNVKIVADQMKRLTPEDKKILLCEVLDELFPSVEVPPNEYHLHIVV